MTTRGDAIGPLEGYARLAGLDVAVERLSELEDRFAATIDALRSVDGALGAPEPESTLLESTTPLRFVPERLMW